MTPTTTVRVECVIVRLRELIQALERRTPRPERPMEHQIAAESAALRKEAVARLAQLETRKPS